MNFQVLVVEDERPLLNATLETLRLEPNLDLHEAETLSDALAVLNRIRPDLLITDLQLGDDDAIELVREIQRRDLKLPIIVTTGFKAPYLSKLSENPDFTILAKPVSIGTLRQLVRDRLADGRTTVAESSPFGIIEYLQLAGLSRQSVRFNFELSHGEAGELTVVKGEVWGARLGSLEGTDAAAKILTSTVHKLSFTSLTSEPEQRSIHASTESLLLRLAAQLDEARRDDETDAASAEANAGRFDEECQDLCDELDGSLAAFAFDFGYRGLAGLHAVEFDSEDASTIAQQLSQCFLLSDSATDDVQQLNEMSLGTHNLRATLERRGHGVVGALATKTVRPGLMMMALRGCPLSLDETESKQPDDDSTQPPRETFSRDLDPSLTTLCFQAASGVVGARCCNMVDVKKRVVLAISHDEIRDVDDVHSLCGFDLFCSARDSALGTFEDLALTSDRMLSFFVAVTGTDRVVQMTTSPETRRGEVIVALKELVQRLSKSSSVKTY